jgi:hypothetical protein
VQTEKDQGDDPRGGPAGDFLCYEIRCQRHQPPATPSIEDQFGHRPVRLRDPKFVCTPAERLPVGPPTPCGSALCDAGTICCNPLEGICVKPGQVCIQQ